jgi:putative addiction module CopG family antidote
MVRTVLGLISLLKQIMPRGNLTDDWHIGTIIVSKIMKIELNPDDEQLIQKRLQSGAFHTIDEVIHDALTSQDAEENWLQENREAIHTKISRGLAQLESGEKISGDLARARLQERKAAWLAERKRS